MALVGGERRQGDPGLTAHDARYAYRFASARHRELFLADPGRYGIQAEGGCAGMRAETAAGSGSPSLFTVYGGRIWIFASETCRRDFLEDPEDFVAAIERVRASSRQRRRIDPAGRDIPKGEEPAGREIPPPVSFERCGGGVPCPGTRPVGSTCPVGLGGVDGAGGFGGTP